MITEGVPPSGTQRYIISPQKRKNKKKLEKKFSNPFKDAFQHSLLPGYQL